MIVKMDALSSGESYHLITQTLIPRPIAWVLTKNTSDCNELDAGNVGVGDYNLAPFSYFTAVASEP